MKYELCILFLPYYDISFIVMGNSCCNGYLAIDSPMTCSRCHREGHSRSVCYASRYSDGSKIQFWCEKHRCYHTTPCYQSKCSII